MQEHLLQHSLLLGKYWIFCKEKQSDDYDKQITTGRFDSGAYWRVGRRIGYAQGTARDG
jgi:hypothetical protein